MFIYYIMDCIHKEKITENKKEYFNNYRFKNREKINEYQRHQYHAKKNKINKIKNDIKTDIEKLKENFRLLHGDHDDSDINILIIVITT